MTLSAAFPILGTTKAGICKQDNIYESKKLIIAASLGYVKKWYFGDELFIHEFFVHNEFQRHGIGSKLLSNIENDLKKKNITNITLLTNKKYPAFNFYKYNNFNTIKNLKFMVRKIK